VTDRHQLAAPTFDVRVVARDGFECLELSGDLDLGAVKPFRVMIDLLRPFAGPVRVDIGNVDFIDSSGLHLLTDLRREVEQAGQSFEVSRPSPAALRVFEITGLLDAFNIIADDSDQPHSVQSIIQNRVPRGGGWVTDAIFVFADGIEGWSVDEPARRTLDGLPISAAYRLFRDRGRLESSTRRGSDALNGTASIAEPA
jgi:anti-sigma B factor antagonist